MRHKLYAIILCAMMAALLFAGCAAEEETVWADEAAADDTAGYRRTVLYYQSDDGFMVPVMKLIPWEEGIGRAALTQLVDTDENRVAAASMGLKNVLPDGVTFVLSIDDDATATVNICDLPDFETSVQEENMVCAVVNTLTEFPSIDRVRFTFDGKTRKKLANGTSVNGTFEKQPLNIEPLATSADTDARYPVTLYFPNRSASLNVPVTRFIGGEPTLLDVIRELLNGPADQTLRSCFPDGTNVISASLLEDVAIFNFSSEFSELADTPALEQAAIETLQLCAKSFCGASEVRLLVEGDDYTPASKASGAAPLYVNQFR